jgi:hypothetical protein
MMGLPELIIFQQSKIREEITKTTCILSGHYDVTKKPVFLFFLFTHKGCAQRSWRSQSFTVLLNPGNDNQDQNGSNVGKHIEEGRGKRGTSRLHPELDGVDASEENSSQDSAQGTPG